MSISAIAITYGGKRIPFTNSDLQEMLDHPNVYEMADNLPKWIAVRHMALKNISFNAAYKLALNEIRAAINLSNRVIFNVRSDRRTTRPGTAYLRSH